MSTRAQRGDRGKTRGVGGIGVGVPGVFSAKKAGGGGIGGGQQQQQKKNTSRWELQNIQWGGESHLPNSTASGVSAGGGKPTVVPQEKTALVTKWVKRIENINNGENMETKEKEDVFVLGGGGKGKKRRKLEVVKRVAYEVKVKRNEQRAAEEQ